MMSANLIYRYFQSQRWDALLEALSANGMDLPLSLRVRLSEYEAATMALGLRRLIELTYGPTVASGAMVDGLLHLQDADGSFNHDPLATACAVAAMHAVLAEHSVITQPELSIACERAMAALAAMQADDPDDCGFRCAVDRTVEDRELVAAFILSLLADMPEFRSAVRVADLLGWFESRRNSLDAAAQRFWRLSQYPSPRPTGRGATLAA